MKTFYKFLIFSVFLNYQIFCQTFPQNGDVQQIYFVDSTLGIIAGHYYTGDSEFGQIFKTTDGGIIWNYKTTPINAYSYSGLKVFKDGIGYVAVKTLDGTLVLKTTDFGETWDSTLNIIDKYFIPKSLSFIDEKNGWAISNDSLYKTTNGGIDWKTNPLDTSISYKNDIYILDKNTGFLCGGKQDAVTHNLISLILKTTNGGSNWYKVFREVEKTANIYAGINSLDFNNKIGIGVGERDSSTLFISTDEGESWTTRTIADRFNTAG